MTCEWSIARDNSLFQLYSIIFFFSFFNFFHSGDCFTKKISLLF